MLNIGGSIFTAIDCTNEPNLSRNLTYNGYLN